MTDRIACVNPHCRRTAAADKHPDSTWIICRKCYSNLPAQHRERFKFLHKRGRKLNRIADRSVLQLPHRQQQWFQIDRMYDRSWDRLLAQITHYFTSPNCPVGLEDFMKDNGLV